MSLPRGSVRSRPSPAPGRALSRLALASCGPDPPPPGPRRTTPLLTSRLWQSTPQWQGRGTRTLRPAKPRTFTSWPVAERGLTLRATLSQPCVRPRHTSLCLPQARLRHQTGAPGARTWRGVLSARPAGAPGKSARSPALIPSAPASEFPTGRCGHLVLEGSWGVAGRRPRGLPETHRLSGSQGARTAGGGLGRRRLGFLRRPGTGSDWKALGVPRVSWLPTCNLG